MKGILSFVLLAFFVMLYSCNNSNSEDIDRLYPDNITPGKDTLGKVYFSFNNGKTWENKSDGLPGDIIITDLTSSAGLLVLSTKQHGIFIYNMKNNTWENALSNPAPGTDIDVVSIFNNTIYAGTRGKGIYLSSDYGSTWTENNQGLGNMIIRRFAFINNKLYACTNGGVYSFDKDGNQWEYEFGRDLQVNGIAEYGADLYAGTNKGIYKYSESIKEWDIIKNDLSLHNISSAGNRIYAMTYNELFYSSNKGETWLSGQGGLPENLYTFQIIQKNNTIFAGQWNGVYSSTGQDEWKLSSNGMPPDFAATELSVFNNIIVAGGTKGKAVK